MGSCTALELVAQNTYVRGLPQLYNSCSGSASHGPYTPLEEAYGSSDFKLQNARPSPYCLYSQTHTNPSTAFPPVGNCFGYFADEWMTFQIGVTLGPRIGDEFSGSHIQMWAAREGMPSQLIHDWIFNLTAGPATDNPLQKFGQLFLTPYMTGKDPLISRPIAYTWCDDLIVSRNRISDLSAPIPPAPQDLCISDPLRITGVKWPSAQTGSRSISYNSGTKKVASVVFTWPGTLKVTDTRNCVAIVNK